MKVTVPLGITAATSPIDTGTQKNTWFWDNYFNNFKQRNDIIKIVQALEDSNILLKGVTKTIKNDTKKQKGGFLSMLLGTLGAILLGNMLARKVIVTAGSGNKKGKEIIRAGYGKDWVYNATSSFNRHWNTKVLSKWNKI